MNWSMQMRPTMGRRAPRTSTSPFDESARPAVAVADRDGDDARVRARGPGRAVADGRARPHHLK